MRNALYANGENGRDGRPGGVSRTMTRPDTSALLPTDRLDQTDLEETVPTSSAEGDTIPTDSQGTDSIIVSRQDTNPLALECIPDITVVIVVPGKQDSARVGECDRGDTAEDIVVGVGVEFTIGSEIE